MKNAIDVRSIVKKFGQFTAVDGISFAVEEGEIFGLLGPNGAGKSTLIRMLVTLLPPTAGTALVGGFDIIKQADDVRRTIGVIAQAMTSDLDLSVEENLLIYSKLYGVPREKRQRLIPNCSNRSNCCSGRTNRSRTSRAACAAASKSPAASSTSLACSSSTNRRPVSIRSHAARSGKCCSASRNSAT
jgi:ABC-2 type transport system ATP-binding protein